MKLYKQFIQLQKEQFTILYFIYNKIITRCSIVKKSHNCNNQQYTLILHYRHNSVHGTYQNFIGAKWLDIVDKSKRQFMFPGNGSV
jgi:hypothetical protein